MDLFSRSQLKDLAQADDALCVSLFMPTYRVEAELAQNPIRLKNLVKDARSQLKATGRRDSDVDELLAPLTRLLDNEEYWHAMSDGLAAFVTPSGANFYRLPVSFEELVVVGDRFHLKPLFPLFASNNRFYILALSQNRVRLFQGTHYSINEVHSADIPKDIAEAVLAYETDEQYTSVYTGNRTADGRQDGIQFGQGRQSGDDRSAVDAKVREFFHAVDEGVAGVLEDETAPLLLAGVRHYLPLYREANAYAHLVEDEIVAGNQDHTTPKELHAKAWKIMEPIFMQAQTASIDQYHQRFGREEGLASDDLHEIVPAAVFSRIDTLFVPIGEHRWGHYDPEQNTVELHDERQAGDEDLLDLAAVHTYLNGGTVHALKRMNMPAQQPLAASFRFPAKVAATDS